MKHEVVAKLFFDRKTFSRTFFLYIYDTILVLCFSLASCMIWSGKNKTGLGSNRKLTRLGSFLELYILSCKTQRNIQRNLAVSAVSRG